MIPAPLTKKQKQALRRNVKAAMAAETRARLFWKEVGAQLDEFGSHGHSQCCPIGGMRAAGRNGYSGVSPCPCGWEEK